MLCKWVSANASAEWRVAIAVWVRVWVCASFIHEYSPITRHELDASRQFAILRFSIIISFTCSGCLVCTCSVCVLVVVVAVAVFAAILAAMSYRYINNNNMPHWLDSGLKTSFSTNGKTFFQLVVVAVVVAVVVVASIAVAWVLFIKANAVHGAFQRLFNWLTCCDFGLSSAFLQFKCIRIMRVYKVIKCTMATTKGVFIEYQQTILVYATNINITLWTGY